MTEREQYQYEAERGLDRSDAEVEAEERRIEQDIDEHIERHGSSVPYGGFQEPGPEPDLYIRIRESRLRELRRHARDLGGIHGRAAQFWLDVADWHIESQDYINAVAIAREHLQTKKPGTEAPG
jgi:hypothetical protein